MSVCEYKPVVITKIEGRNLGAVLRKIGFGGNDAALGWETNRVNEILGGAKHLPSRRRVVERTLGWLARRRNLRVRWCNKIGNWLAFVQFACAHIPLDMAIYGAVLN